jgi:prevent-host-death family protein
MPPCKIAIIWLVLGMTTHSVVEAKNQLSELIDRALKGEGVVITRHGRPVVELRPILPAVGPITPEAMDWLVERRVGVTSGNGERLSRRQRNCSVVCHRSA